MTDLHSNLDYALEYARRGWHILPIAAGTKAPLNEGGFKNSTVSEKRIRAWWTKWPDASIAIECGQRSGIIVLDVDSHDGKPGTESLQRIVAATGGFGKAAVVRSGGGGQHFYFKAPEEQFVKRTIGLSGYPGLDLLGEGGYALLPPSIHPSGSYYQWDVSPWDLNWEFPDIPQILIDSARDLGSFIGRKLTQSERNVGLTSIAGTLRAMGAEYETIVLALEDHNIRACEPPLDANEVERIAHYIAGYPPYNSKFEESDDVSRQDLLRFLGNFSDQNCAEALLYISQGRIKCNFDNGKFLIWHDHIWTEDPTAELHDVFELGRQELSKAVPLLERPEDQKEARKGIAKLEDRSKTDNVVEMLRRQPQVRSRSYEWDCNPLLLGARNGTVDLQTGRLLPGRAQDMISQRLEVEYDEDAKAPRWMQCLDEWFLGDKQVIEFVKRCIGYSITGLTIEQCLFLLSGNGANGKSKFLGVIHDALGTYATMSSFKTFERQPNMNTQTNDLAALLGKRFVMISEANEGATWDEARVKSMTGDEPIQARFLHHEFFTFRPVSKLWIGVNHLPRVRDDSYGFWRRVRKIDFNAVFDPKHADLYLGEKLKAEFQGILCWAVEGAVTYLKDGLVVPESVEHSTNIYRDETDPVRDFLSQYTEEGEEYTVFADDFYRAFADYQKSIGVKVFQIPSSVRFHTSVGRKYKRVEEGRKFYQGLRLTSEGLALSSTVSITVRK